MASTNFVDFSTPIVAAWLNDINAFFYSLFGGAVTPFQALTAIGGLSSTNPVISGNLTFASGGARIMGDFSNGPVSNRPTFQTNQVNGNTGVSAIPSGTGIAASFSVHNSSNIDNSAFLSMVALPTSMNIDNSALGSGIVRPLIIQSAGTGIGFYLSPQNRAGVGIGSADWSADNTSLDIGQVGGLAFNTSGGGLYANTYFSQTQANWVTKAAGNAGYFVYNTSAGWTLTAGTGAGAGLVVPLATRLRITNEGLVGIKKEPTYTLDISTSSTFGLRVEDGIVQVVLTPVSSAYAMVGTLTNHSFYLFANNTAHVQLAPSGQFSIGQSAVADAWLSVSGNAAIRPLAAFTGTTAGDNANGLVVSKFSNDLTPGSNIFIKFIVNAGGNGGGLIAASGSGTAAFFNFSDERLKENITDLPPQLDNVLSLRPREFDFKADGSHGIGFIAQEVQEIYPDLIGVGEDGMLMLGGLSKVEARLISAIQELAARVAVLEAK